MGVLADKGNCVSDSCDWGKTDHRNLSPPFPHGMYLRSCIFRDVHGEEIGRATSIWTLMDIEARRIIRSSYVDERHSIAHTLRPATPLPMSVKPLNAETIVKSVTPKFSDFDLNRHVNNTKYIFDFPKKVNPMQQMSFSILPSEFIGLATLSISAARASAPFYPADFDQISACCTSQEFL